MDDDARGRHELTRAGCGYAEFRDGRLVPVADTGRPLPALAEFVHGQFRSLALEPRFPCVGARSAMHQGTYRFAMYGELGSAEATAALCRDLRAFVAEQPATGHPPNTFVACFAGPTATDDAAFRSLVRLLTDGLVDDDAEPWDPAVSSNPEDPHYAFSFAGRAFTIVGLHAGSPRWARRFAWPTIVFNAERLFLDLRREGKLTRFQQVIRKRDVDLQGCPNPEVVREDSPE